jgi:hypothetical protein
VVVVLLVEVVDAKLQLISYYLLILSVFENDFTCCSSSCRRSGRYLIQIIITEFKFKVYVHVVEVVLVELVLLVDVLVAKLKLISCLSHNKCRPQYVYLT